MSVAPGKRAEMKWPPVRRRVCTALTRLHSLLFALDLFGPQQSLHRKRTLRHLLGEVDHRGIASYVFSGYQRGSQQQRDRLATIRHDLTGDAYLLRVSVRPRGRIFAADRIPVVEHKVTGSKP